MRTLIGLLAATILTAMPAGAADELSWDDLIPSGYEEPITPGEPLHDPNSLGNAVDESGAPAAQLEPMAPVVSELDGREVRLPGYIVPLDISDGRVVEFLLVPYFGACIHVPPPPSNQVVHVLSQQGIELDALYQPFWITGPMRVETVQSELANAGYRISASQVEPYEY